MSKILRIARCDRGATAIEYGLIVALIALAAMGAINLTASKTMGLWNRVSNAVSNS